MGRAEPDRGELRIEQWSLADVAEAVDARSRVSDRRRPGGVSTDSRTIERGELFVALRGEHFDGHDYVGEAADEGACGAVVRSDWDDGDVSEAFPLIRVADTRSSLAKLGASIWREARSGGLHTVDVTGSNGKTTTKELLAAIWSTRGSVYSTPGNYNNEIGLPLTLCGLPASCDHLVLEIGANAPGEISELVALAPGEQRVVTSIGRDHLGGFGSIAGVRAAKSEVFEESSAETTAVVPYGERDRLHLQAFPGEVWTFGGAKEADVHLAEYRPSAEHPGRYEAEYRVDDASLTLEIGLPGRFNALNLGCALATMLARGERLESGPLQSALRSVELPGGRWRIVDRGDLRFVDDAYNANPTSVRASFRAFVEMDEPEFETGTVERIAVVGDMRELGDAADEWHGRIAAEIADSEAVAALACVGEFRETAAEGAERADAGTDVRRFAELEALAEWLEHRTPAFVWLKASRANRLERLVDLTGNSSESE